MIALASLSFGYGIYLREARQTVRAIEADLELIAEFKADHLLNWRTERIAAAEMHASGIIRERLLSWLENPASYNLSNFPANGWSRL